MGYVVAIACVVFLNSFVVFVAVFSHLFAYLNLINLNFGTQNFVSSSNQQHIITTKEQV